MEEKNNYNRETLVNALKVQLKSFSYKELLNIVDYELAKPYDEHDDELIELCFLNLQKLADETGLWEKYNSRLDVKIKRFFKRIGVRFKLRFIYGMKLD